MTVSIAVLGILLGVLGCRSTLPRQHRDISALSQQPSPPLVVRPHERQPERGVFVVVHGLNTRADALRSIEDWLCAAGYGVVRVTLSGHDPRQRHASGGSHELWCAEVLRALQHVRACRPQQPCYGLGYSLGGALLVSVQEQSLWGFDGLVLVAPALSLRSRVYLTWPLTLFRGSGLAVPSVAPEAYRAFAKTSVDSYHGLFATVKSVQGVHSLRRSAVVPGLVIVTADDELIDANATEAWVARQKLEKWRVQRVSSVPYHHLMVDAATLGAEGWQQLLSALKRFLREQLHSREV